MSEAIHGLLLVNKPSGVTSHDIVNQTRRLLGIKEVGHAGTLDPLAEGLMVLLLGEATKLSSYILEQDKKYEVTFRLGLETDTLDCTGQVIKQSDVFLTDEEVIGAASALTGDFQWEVPLYSATKVAGRRLYDQARSGEQPTELPKKPMSFWNVQLVGVTPDHDFKFSLQCSKGSFVRTWVQQLGRLLGCGAVMTALQRTASSPYQLHQAIPLGSDLCREVIKKHPSAYIPLLGTLPGYKVVRVSGYSEGLIRNGQISHELRRYLIAVFDPDKDLGVKVVSQRPEELLAIIGIEKDKGFVVRRVFRC